MANILGVDMGMFYKRRDYAHIVNGANPIVAHEFLGADLSGKDVVIIDDMISSGDSMIDVARELKNARPGESSSAQRLVCSPTVSSALTVPMRKVSSTPC